ncbi:hypothetical protein BpHYR1_037472 [Brachionus plicatilis]|uniref:Uncharacterized protein n=1 Tax=Brachionus plicatilis TaxID=10195 RepID=A0A3M7RDA2_BRAPC|nr:hypothetical protein BpHYR1_037472 [Brachionus plicatilis]
MKQDFEKISQSNWIFGQYFPFFCGKFNLLKLNLSRIQMIKSRLNIQYDINNMTPNRKLCA